MRLRRHHRVLLPLAHGSRSYFYHLLDPLLCPTPPSIIPNTVSTRSRQPGNFFRAQPYFSFRPVKYLVTPTPTLSVIFFWALKITLLHARLLALFAKHFDRVLHSIDQRLLATPVSVSPYLRRIYKFLHTSSPPCENPWCIRFDSQRTKRTSFIEPRLAFFKVP